MQFPSHFPEDCPPDEAKEYEGPLFRFAWDNTKDIEDPMNHKSKAELFAQTGEKKHRYPDEKACQACALSVYVRKQDIQDYVDKAEKESPAFAKRLRQKPIFELRVIQPDGKLQHTPGVSPAHYSFWVRAELDIRERIVKP